MEQRIDSNKGNMYQTLKNKMRIKATADHLEVGFYGRMGYVATNHHFGKTLQRKSRSGSTYSVDLPLRELLGLNSTDQQAIQQILSKHIGVSL
jgi:phage virion morphogenesis protein